MTETLEKSDIYYQYTLQIRRITLNIFLFWLRILQIKFIVKWLNLIESKGLALVRYNYNGLCVSLNMKYIMKLNYTNEIQEGTLEHSTTRKLHITEAHARLYIHSLQQFNFVNHIIYTHQST